MRILLAEDERDLNRIIAKKLTADGYSVDCCFDGAEALDYAASADYDVMVLDIMMPKLDGLAVLRTLRQRGDATPVLLLTARDAVADRVKGLDSGANDYLVKPFSLEELAARLRALTRTRYGQASAALTVADLTLDSASHTVTRGGRPITLPAKEFQLLEYLMHNQGRVLSREQIENHIWNFDYEGGTNVVDVYISYLRKKIDGGQAVKLIHTVRSRGYVLKEGDPST
mgnify:FL=1